MSQTDVETLRAGYEAVSRGDWDTAFRAMHPDLEWKPADRHPLAGTYQGREQVRKFFEDQWEPFEEMVVEPEEFFEGTDQIVAYVLLRARPKDSSATMEIRVGHLWTMRDGKAARCEVFPAREEALEAAGLSEPDAHDDS